MDRGAWLAIVHRVAKTQKQLKRVSTHLEKAMATHSSTVAWKIPWKEEPGRLQSMRSLRVDTTEWLHFHFSLSFIGEGNGNPLQCSCMENPRDKGAWWTAICGVARSWTGLKRLSLSSSIYALYFIWQHYLYWNNNYHKSELSACIWNQADYWDVLLNPNVQTQWFNDTLIIISEGRTQTWMFQGTQVILNVQVIIQTIVL